MVFVIFIWRNFSFSLYDFEMQFPFSLIIGCFKPLNLFSGIDVPFYYLNRHMMKFIGFNGRFSYVGVYAVFIFLLKRKKESLQR